MVDRLRKRRDFLAAAKAGRAGVSVLGLQGRDRADGGDIRVGFTVTKKNGNAVVRNRIRRRLRAAAGAVLPEAGRAGHDYVLIARAEALRAPFPDLVSDLGRALRKLHDPRPKGGPRTSGRRAPESAAPPHARPPTDSRARAGAVPGEAPPRPHDSPLPDPPSQDRTRANARDPGRADVRPADGATE